MRIRRRLPFFLGLTGAALGHTLAARGQPADPAISYVGVSGRENQKLVVMNADGSNATAILTPSAIGGSFIGDPVWSPDGGQIAFRVDGGSSPARSGLWRLDVTIEAGKPKGLNPTQLTSAPPGGLSGRTPAWSPAGDRIAYYGLNGLTRTIQTVPAIGGAPTVLYATGESIGSLAWSPDATRIAFLENDPEFDAFCIRVLDTATGAATTVLPGAFAAQFGNGGGGYRGLDWARTGDVLAFSVGTESTPGGTAIYLLNLSGGPPVLAADSGVQPTWAPDDSALVFCDREDSSKLRRVNLLNGSVTTFKGRLGREPDWRRY